MKHIAALAFGIGFLCSSVLSAQTSTCDQLDAQQKKVAKGFMDTLHPYRECDGTIATCVKKKSKLAIRLADNLCRRVAKGESEKKIKRWLEERAKSMNPYGKKATINTGGFPAVGTGSVTVVVYACARCPFCSKLVPKLHKAVTSGALKGKVTLYFKPFPLKSHEYSKEGGLATVAALHMGHYWDYLLRLYENFDMFCKDKLDDWAELEGMDPARFNELMKDAAVRKELVDSKKEGLANGVSATPTLFINGRKYTGFLDVDEIVDVLEEEHSRTAK
ncbi:MAG: thioredoxin domain-containing protein [Deltaproteobacteria bacterium]|nr:thioredoxin domain-containing protein [Deltaproteobacteria bacterium]MBN2672094.1 thioredoxin domain-containing protein [Deltaproteobacteria bacterium]